MAANPRLFCGDFNCRLINNEYFLMLWITFVFTERDTDLNPISKVNTEFWESNTCKHTHTHAQPLPCVCTVFIRKYSNLQQFSEIWILFWINSWRHSSESHKYNKQTKVNNLLILYIYLWAARGSPCRLSFAADAPVPVYLRSFSRLSCCHR